MFTGKTKRVVAVHDLSGVGRVSLSVVIPVLSNMGFNVSSLPTSILSNHTQYPSFSFLDLTDEMRKILAQWKLLDIEFDAIYTGYLGSVEQVNIIKEFVCENKRNDTLIMIDPVLGDNAKLYANFNEDMVIAMRKLIGVADVVTPNLTELFFLLDIPYSEYNGDEELKILMLELSKKGPDIVIITNVPEKVNPHITSVYAYNKKGHRFWKVTCPYLPAHFPGMGDTFTSVITGALLQGDSLPMALDRAAQFCYQGIRATFGYEYDRREGIMLEKVLRNLELPIQVTSYELI
ncbi:MAG: pyridoxamine kinase [Bacteroidales bacterium]|jgi:pyridoxine kinase|nr:pyridoxamine kinase [Bacteroidales bacterium]